MDIVQAKTFLTIVEVRNFKQAAEKLFVTQSTISARVKSLEEQLDCKLFIRNKAGVTLTDAAVRFERHAQSIVQLWDHAKKEVAMTDDINASLTIGARYGLWEPLLLDWLLDLRSMMPGSVINARIGTPSSLIQKMHNGTMDICLVYAPYSNQGLRVHRLFDEKFIMVSSQRGIHAELDETYAYVHWGSEFVRKHKLHYPDYTLSKLSADLGALAEKLIVKAGMKGYLPRRTIEKSLAEGLLFEVEDAPEISLPVFMVYSELIPEDQLKIIRDSLISKCSAFK
ncbi:transcriptional regulator [Kordiimonas sediminis]|uniref:Transcriptional regulator n=1 Tax=Kordiimonas sediminis TaxID=1735581 RepID=A0A919ARM3_9PROT|nr:LysR family transcriptional regulator [Kordiimonas sediminis]GHF20102.1 transcriptional regulator [Kordiimonas sediminis]